MQNESNEIITPAEEPKKDTRFPTIIISIFALLLAIYATIIGTYSFFYIASHKNQFTQSTIDLSSITKQHTDEIESLQVSVAALQKAAKQKTEKLPSHVQTIFSDIASIDQQIQAMSILPKAPTLTINTAVEENNTAITWRERVKNSLKQIKGLFIVRHVDQNSLPFISQNNEIIMKQNIAIQLSIAQWALIHHDKVVYQTSLKTVSSWLTQYFPLSDETKAIVTKINALQNTNPPTQMQDNTNELITNN